MDPILLGKGITDDIAVTLLPKLGNRHGLVAGATGTGKTVTLMTLAEGFSRLGVPVFLADVKGDVSGLAVPGSGAENLLQRAEMPNFAARFREVRTFCHSLPRNSRPLIRNRVSWATATRRKPRASSMGHSSSVQE